jgi:hypothetical protein
MSDFFYSLPIALAAALVLGAALLIGLASSLGLRTLFRLKPSSDEENLAMTLMQVVAAYIGIMIAFAGVVVWQAYDEAETAIQDEAQAASELYRDMTAYGPETLPARHALRAYVESIVHDEWPRLTHGESSVATEVALARLFSTIGSIRPTDHRDSAIFSQVFANLNDMVAFRRDRLTHSQSTMPIQLWLIGLAGSLFVIAYASIFKPTRLTIVMISGISITFGLVFLFILTVDRPFKGPFSVSNQDFMILPARFDMIDAIAPAHENK